MAGSSASSGIISGSNVSSSSLLNLIPEQNGFLKLPKNRNKSGSTIGNTGKTIPINISEMIRRGISVKLLNNY